MKKITLFIILIMIFFTNNKVSANYEKIFYDFGGNLIGDRFELSKKIINLIK